MLALRSGIVQVTVDDRSLIDFGNGDLQSAAADTMAAMLIVKQKANNNGCDEPLIINPHPLVIIPLLVFDLRCEPSRSGNGLLIICP